MEFIQSGRNLKYVHSQIRSISVKVACDFIYCPPKLIAAVDVSQGRGRHHCSSLVTAASCRENPVKLFSALLWQGLMNSQGCCQTYVVSAVIVCMLKRQSMHWAPYNCFTSSISPRVALSTMIVCTSLTLILHRTLKKEPMHICVAFCIGRSSFIPSRHGMHDFYQSGRDSGRKEQDVWLKVTTVVNVRGRGGYKTGRGNSHKTANQLAVMAKVVLQSVNEDPSVEFLFIFSWTLFALKNKLVGARMDSLAWLHSTQQSFMDS